MVVPANAVVAVDWVVALMTEADGLQLHVTAFEYGLNEYKRPAEGATAFASFAVDVLEVFVAKEILLNVPLKPQIPAEILVDDGVPMVP